jgi:hypothetical protein
MVLEEPSVSSPRVDGTYQTTQHHIPGDSTLHSHYENFNSNSMTVVTRTFNKGIPFSARNRLCTAIVFISLIHYYNTDHVIKLLVQKVSLPTYIKKLCHHNYIHQVIYEENFLDTIFHNPNLEKTLI